MYCQNCGHELPEHASYCPFCGKPYSQESGAQRKRRADLDYMKYDSAINLEKYRNVFIRGYMINAVVTLGVLVFWFLAEPINFNPYFFEDVFNWPVIIGGLAASIICTLVVRTSSIRQAGEMLLVDMKIVGKRMMWNIRQNNKPLFDTIKQMDLNDPAYFTIQEIILSTSVPTTKLATAFVIQVIHANYSQLGIIMQSCAKEIEEDIKEEMV